MRAADLGDIVEVSQSVAIAAGANATVSVACPTGTRVISGGAQPANFGVEMTTSKRNTNLNGWTYQARNQNGSGSTLTVYAYCLSG